MSTYNQLDIITRRLTNYAQKLSEHQSRPIMLKNLHVLVSNVWDLFPIQKSPLSLNPTIILQDIPNYIYIYK